MSTTTSVKSLYAPCIRVPCIVISSGTSPVRRDSERGVCGRVPNGPILGLIFKERKRAGVDARRRWMAAGFFVVEMEMQIRGVSLHLHLHLMTVLCRRWSSLWIGEAFRGSWLRVRSNCRVHHAAAFHADSRDLFTLDINSLSSIIESWYKLARSGKPVTASGRARSDAIFYMLVHRPPHCYVLL